MSIITSLSTSSINQFSILLCSESFELISQLPATMKLQSSYLSICLSLSVVILLLMRQRLRTPLTPAATPARLITSTNLCHPTVTLMTWPAIACAMVPMISLVESLRTRSWQLFASFFQETDPRSGQPPVQKSNADVAASIRIGACSALSSLTSRQESLQLFSSPMARSYCWNYAVETSMYHIDFHYVHCFTTRPCRMTEHQMARAHDPLDTEPFTAAICTAQVCRMWCCK